MRYGIIGADSSFCMRNPFASQCRVPTQNTGFTTVGARPTTTGGFSDPVNLFCLKNPSALSCVRQKANQGLSGVAQIRPIERWPNRKIANTAKTQTRSGFVEVQSDFSDRVETQELPAATSSHQTTSD